ncbi:CobN/magnesium chelatase family protein [Prevotella intermedia]|uniref:CobN/magnesium chelatase family protein n=1 Tax=Prevotella intermedia TaxID=28131 RepID=A0AAD1BHW9_PREIN|nr:cobaltochelatase subunit CobN [Prevotella intermedia]AFJ07847.1 CobN/magnesium chelatase domain protein [Prevotella intermedia 17]APW35281.1 protoporphyrin IX magnesium chelatase [Prevotella intermedia]BAR96822.1 CobN/magnesium chelatase family protein [Prevotella intermedia]
MKKRRILIVAAVAALLLIGFGVWSKWLSTTRIAFVNYQTITLGQIARANDNPLVKIENLTAEDLAKADGYDMVFVQAMGLRLTEEQRTELEKAMKGGTPVVSTMITNPDNDFCSVDTADANRLKAYIDNGGRENYRNLLSYVRKHIDKKIIYAPEAGKVVERIYGLIYHADPDRPDDEDKQFNSVAEYNKFLKEKGLWKDNAPAVIITGSMGEPKELIAELEKTGNVVYPVNSVQKFVENQHADSVNVSAIINMAHGRLGDAFVDYLKRVNVPFFAPLNVNRLEKKWESDNMGMNGGFLSQSVVTPEIDGALRPFALFAHYVGKDDLEYVAAMPERLGTFVQTVNNYIGLKHKPNSQKRVAIYYYKGPGQNAMTAGGMEVGPSLYNLLLRLKQEGYNVAGLPDSAEGLMQAIQRQGAVFNLYAKGAFDDFMKNGKPALVSKNDYDSWVKKTLRPEKYQEVVKANGEFPGEFMATPDGKLAVARVQFGNVVLLPQNAAGKGDNAFQIVHGTDAAPPHTYIASYLWTQYGFKADVLIHFGTHGSLEFTPKKQVALSNLDWPDRLVGAMPHFYLYTIGNVGEGLIAKRRSYAGLQSYLTPPFMESGMRGTYGELSSKLKLYTQNIGKDKALLQQTSLAIKALVVRLGFHRDLGLDSVLTRPYTEEDILRIDNFAEELSNEKITGQLYTLGVPYEAARINSSLLEMCTDPVAYSLFTLDKVRGKATEALLKRRSEFNSRYLYPAKALVQSLIGTSSEVTDAYVCKVGNLSPADLQRAHKIYEDLTAPSDMMKMMAGMGAMGKKGKGGSGMPAGMGMPKGMGKMPSGMGKSMPKGHAMQGGHGSMPPAAHGGKMPEGMGKKPANMGEKPSGMGKGMPAMGKSTHGKSMSGMPPKGMSGMGAMMKDKKKSYSKEDKAFAFAVRELERTLKSIGKYKQYLLASPQMELESMINAMNGGYTAPSPGGDPIVNPNTLPTGRNLFGINAEATPSEAAWEKGKQLAENTIEIYKRRHNGELPHKVSFTLWSGEFIETEGATIAQVLYMLGVEPIRDSFGRVSDLRLIPSKELGRKRIDVVVQTSGQLRDLAASRLFLINKAVEMAANAKDDAFENEVSIGMKAAERHLTEKGVSPKEARKLASQRIFGGMNGNYGTGIQGMVMSGDRWEKREEIANTYINNMGTFYGSEKDWEQYNQYAFEAALTRTDVVVQPRQSNTWGALSLDHVYEFMGGLNLAVRHVTGKDPDAYLSDYRNKHNVRMQEVKEAIGVESRTTILNPVYIKEKMKGGASSAGGFAEVVENTYGWNVMKPKAIDKELWDEIYQVYVKDKYNLGTQAFFEQKNPAALQQITAVMLETVRKGMWKATPQQVADIAKLHVDLVKKYKPSGSAFVTDNAKLRNFIASKVEAKQGKEYEQQIDKMRNAAANADKGTVMKREDMSQQVEKRAPLLSKGLLVGGAVLLLVALLVFVVRKRRNTKAE